jgi:hypothetical protein
MVGIAISIAVFIGFVAAMIIYLIVDAAGPSPWILFIFALGLAFSYMAMAHFISKGVK